MLYHILLLLLLLLLLLVVVVFVLLLLVLLLLVVVVHCNLRGSRGSARQAGGRCKDFNPIDKKYKQ